MQVADSAAMLLRMLLDLLAASQSAVLALMELPGRLATSATMYTTLLGRLHAKQHCCLLALVPDLEEMRGSLPTLNQSAGRAAVKRYCKDILRHVHGELGGSVHDTLNTLCDEIEGHHLSGCVNIARIREFASPTADMSAFLDLPLKHVLPTALAALIWMDRMEDMLLEGSELDLFTYVPAIWGVLIGRHMWWSGTVQVTSDQAGMSAEEARRDLVHAVAQMQAAMVQSADLQALQRQHAAELQQLRQQHAAEVQQLRQQLRVRADRLDAELTNVAQLVTQVEQLQLQQQQSSSS